MDPKRRVPVASQSPSPLIGKVSDYGRVARSDAFVNLCFPVFGNATSGIEVVVLPPKHFKENTVYDFQTGVSLFGIFSSNLLGYRAGAGSRIVPLA